MRYSNLYVNWENGGRGLIQLKLTYKTTIKGLKKYLGWILPLVNTHEKEKKKKDSIIKESNKLDNQFNFAPTEIDQKD